MLYAAHARPTHTPPAPAPHPPNQALADAASAADPDAIAASVGRRALRVRLHGVNGLLANGLLEGTTAAAEVRTYACVCADLHVGVRACVDYYSRTAPLCSSAVCALSTHW
jgi:hypothetical protein